MLKQITDAGKRVGKYLLSKMDSIFKNVAFNSLKKFVKTFMDILINLVKSTIKKFMKIAKTLVMSTVDAIKTIANKNASRAEKADSVMKLYGIAITNIVIEVIFEFIEKGAHIPEWMLKPLQLLTSVVCTNATMLILEKADLFDVRFGFKINKIKEEFANANAEYADLISNASEFTNEQINYLIDEAKNESIIIYNNLRQLNPYENSVVNDLKKTSDRFNMGLNFDDEWQNFIGYSIA